MLLCKCSVKMSLFRTVVTLVYEAEIDQTADGLFSGYSIVMWIYVTHVVSSAE